MYSQHTRLPDSYRVPPLVTKYANTPEYFRHSEPNKYTKPCQNGFKDYMRFTDDTPQRDKYIKPDSEISSIKKIDYASGVNRFPYRISMDKPRWCQEYHRNDETVSLAKRNLAFYKHSSAVQKPHLYSFSNQMTSTQYRKPLNSLYGHMLREKPTGINLQRNRHGFMFSADYYS